MKIKKLFNKINNLKERIDEKFVVGGYKLKFKWLREKDQDLQNGNRFFSRRK